MEIQVDILSLVLRNKSNPQIPKVIFFGEY
ncbi:hypothetical protein LSS_21730 [Leptospira santarosai serovar Shermani str. LT 821]|uniref:Uncharacterized protein n=1 Tax=Leptospira santarosai serovar Shermani str. LT 821 TaxID=758847 RepID=A0A097ESK0_9LEPT|nr:hypothetical protein LSS_21730 [Leptospira santarosai serovar Shermani str. LT 821]